MPTIKLSKGESLVKLMVNAGLAIDSLTGIWFIQKGSLQKVAINEESDQVNYRVVLNIYSQGDYFMGDSDLFIDYIAIEDADISEISLSEIDPMQLLYQLDAIEELRFVNSHKLEGSFNQHGKINKFLDWASKRLSKEKSIVLSLISQSTIGQLVGVTRITTNKKLKEIRKHM
jgi:CRP-like cAMP-binding protein